MTKKYVEKKDNVKETSDQSTKYLNGKPIDTSITGKTPLHLAAEKGNLYLTARLLLSEGADLNAQDEGGWTPLHYAVHSGDIDLVKSLIDRGANLSITNYCAKDTPVSHAFQYGPVELVKYFVEKLGIDPMTIKEYDFT